MTIIASIVINLFVIQLLPYCETIDNIKKHDRCTLIQETLQNERSLDFDSGKTLEIDIQFQNLKTTINNTRYEKRLTFFAHDLHFDIYLKKQPIFHHNMTVTHYAGNDPYIEIPEYYVGFSYNISLSFVHGRFYNNNFKSLLIWENETIEINCPNTTAVNRDNHMHDVLCEVKFIQNIITNSTNHGCHESNILPVNWLDFIKKALKRSKRTITEPRSCKIHIVADHLFFRNVGSMSYGSTVEAMMSGVAVADTIFRSTDFDGDGFGDNIGFVVGNITIYSSQDDPNYKLKEDIKIAKQFLETFSRYDFNSYCLGVAFTYRDFSQGTVGLSWVAASNPNAKSGGICSTRDGQFSYNTLWVTQLNGGEYFPGYKSAFALTHEFGHSFGSPHDDLNDKKCTPQGEDGNYIMHAFVISGEKPNNKLFSSCSIENMYPVIVRKGSLCLHKDKGPICGNGIREDGEDCDCGPSGTCIYVDPCCVPSDISNDQDTPCTYIHGKRCSPKRSPCCTAGCEPISASKKQICRPKTDCTGESYCDGVNPSCPDSVLLPDGKPCNGGRKICKSGKCFKSICEGLKLKDCQCTTEKLFCDVCCKAYNASDVRCKPVGDFMTAPEYSKGLKIQPGQRCNGNKGYCDEEHICILNTQEDALNILETFLGSAFRSDIDIWFENYWHYVFGAFILCSAILAIFVVTYQKHRDSHIEALRVAKLTTALTETLHQKRIYLKKIDNLKNGIEHRNQQITLGKRMDFTEAVGRLSLLFPTAPTQLISDVAKCSANEEAAVRVLLIRGFPMRSFCVLVPKDSEHCLLEVNPNKNETA